MDCDGKQDHKEADDSVDDAHISSEVIYSISALLRKGEIVNREIPSSQDEERIRQKGSIASDFFVFTCQQ